MYWLMIVHGVSHGSCSSFWKFGEENVFDSRGEGEFSWLVSVLFVITSSIVFVGERMVWYYVLKLVSIGNDSMLAFSDALPSF